MIREIYCRNENDPGFNPRTLETSNELEVLLTKIRMIIFTSRGEVLGNPSLGLSLDEQLFELNANTSALQKSFYDQLAMYVPESGKYRVEIDVKFQQGEVRDFCFLDIYIDGSKYMGVLAK
jgi:hypothetical protein